MVWVSYITFYNSRVFGFIVSRIVNRFFIKNGYFKIGSFSLATISGKIMFRDFVYVNEDYSIRIQDGWYVLTTDLINYSFIDKLIIDFI